MAGDDEEGSSDNDSRTAVFTAGVRSNASANSTSTSSPRRRGSRRSRRAQKLAQETRDFVPMGAIFSQSAAYLDPSASTNADIAQPPNNSSHDDADPSSLEMNLGQNRLATGFRPRHPASTADATLKHDRSYSHGSAGTEDGSRDEPIEISSSDDSMADSDDGGMIVNINNGASPSQQDIGVSSDSLDEGEVVSRSDSDPPLSHAAVSDTTRLPSSKLKLEELSPQELELQIRYALYHLDRSQIDLNRPVTCLSCLEQGHVATDCPEKNCLHCNTRGEHSTRRCPQATRCARCRQVGHTSNQCKSDMRVTTVPCDLCGAFAHIEQDCPQRYFPQVSLKSAEGGPVRLWVSCCICASKSHLVGDCPDADRSAAARWSLKSLAPGDILNMNLETSTRGREIEAENRGMRPAGIQIRGRAGVHHAGNGPALSGSDDDQGFLRAPVRRGNATSGQHQIRVDAATGRHDGQSRYDRFDASSNREQPAQGRGNWYATDSFGRRRSRSPREPTADQWRPSDRRAPSPRRFDARSQYRPRSPPRGGAGVDSYRPNNRPPPPNNQLPSRPPQAPRNTGHPPVALPTRKGSNPNLPPKPGAPAQAARQNPFGPGGGGKKKNKKKKPNGKSS